MYPLIIIFHQGLCLTDGVNIGIDGKRKDWIRSVVASLKTRSYVSSGTGGPQLWGREQLQGPPVSLKIGLEKFTKEWSRKDAEVEQQ